METQDKIILCSLTKQKSTSQDPTHQDII